ncbi:MAG: PEP-CTERM sorting domain-containing protein [Pirellulaceae bacterium]
MPQFIVRACLILVALIAIPAAPCASAVIDMTIRGSDAIFLAGRTDVVIPPASSPWNTGTRLIRHASPTPEEIRETLPPFVAVSGGDVIRVIDPAFGGINFFLGYGPPFFGPSGNGSSGSSLTSLDGISGYLGPQGPLCGVFLDNSIPSSGPAPATIDFTPAGLGINFLSVSPQLRQVFYIGDGITSAGVIQTFYAPAGATRLFLGIPDGFGFGGAPGAYDDNDGSYGIRLGINEIPTNVPEPTSLISFLLAVIGVGAERIRRHKVYFEA